MSAHNAGGDRIVADPGMASGPRHPTPLHRPSGQHGAVRIGPDARVLFGAVLTAEDREVSVGARSVVMQNAVIRGRERHPSVIGDDNPTLIVTIWPARKMAG